MPASRAASACCSFTYRSSVYSREIVYPSPRGGGRDPLEARPTGRAPARALGSRRAALTTHQNSGRIGVHLSVGLRVEGGLPAAPIAHLVTWPPGSRNKSESDEPDQDEENHQRIHQRISSPLARSERAT